MVQHTVEHALQVSLTAERKGNRLKVANGTGHAAQHAAQFTHLGNPRVHAHLTAKIKTGQALNLLAQQPQRAANAPAKHTAEHQQYGHQRHGPEQLLVQDFARPHQ
ncbi:hypothetical protein D3C71_1948150 [compost metagenome]